jgi:ATP-dependent DNA helicase RecG
MSSSFSIIPDVILLSSVNVRSEILGVNRQDMYEIPIEVLREASVNALMHRDYSITGTQVSVEVFDERPVGPGPRHGFEPTE